MIFRPVTEVKVFYHRGPDERLFIGILLWDEHTAAFEYPTSRHLLDIAKEASIGNRVATTIIDEVRHACSRWPEFAKGVGLPKSVWAPIHKVLQAKE